MKYIDLHTHQLKNKAIIEIANIFAQDFSETPTENLYSVGLHPWHILKVDWNESFSNITQASKDKNMLFVGECGLDRSVAIDFAKQEECFIYQAEIANAMDKPLIIHCVRAFNDLIRIKKKVKADVPWIIHGYNANKEVTVSLVKQGFYFSIGEKLLFDTRKYACLEIIPIDNLFLESDESVLPIELLYKKTAEILKITEPKLISIVWDNFNKVTHFE